MKASYNQQKISSSLQHFFTSFFSLSKPLIKSISFILTGMICAESVVTSDISRKLKDGFSLVQLESTQRRFRRFFHSFSSIAYSFFESFIKHIISRFCIKYSSSFSILSKPSCVNITSFSSIFVYLLNLLYLSILICNLYNVL